MNNEVCSWEILVPTIKKSWEDCRLPVVDVCVDSFFNNMFEAHSDSERYTKWIDHLIAVMNDTEKMPTTSTVGLISFWSSGIRILLGRKKRPTFMLSFSAE